MTPPQVMNTRQYALQNSYTADSLKVRMRRDSLGAGYGVPVLSYTSLSSPRKRSFVDDGDDDVFSSSRMSSPVKRSRSALKDTNMALYCDDLTSEVGKKTVLGTKKPLANTYTLATKAPLKMLGNGKHGKQIKVIDSKKATSMKKQPLGLTSPSPQRLARKSATLSRVTTTSKSTETARHKALERARGRYSSSPLRVAVSSSDESDSGVLLAAATAASPTVIPESWKFDIYEDSHVETMQNLMEHSATVLDISDESGDEKWGNDEISQKGKENISPERMAELMTGAGRNLMQIDTKKRRMSNEKRAALEELEVRKFYPKEEAKKEEEEKKEASEFVLDFANIPSLDAPSGLGGGAGFEVWASEGESDESDGETSVPLTPPKGLEMKVKIRQEDEIDECASESGASDKEN